MKSFYSSSKIYTSLESTTLVLSRHRLLITKVKFFVMKKPAVLKAFSSFFTKMKNVKNDNFCRDIATLALTVEPYPNTGLEGGHLCYKPKK